MVIVAAIALERLFRETDRYAPIVKVHHTAPHVDRGRFRTHETLDGAGDVFRLPFEHERNAHVIRVRSVHHEEVRKTGDLDAQERLRLIAPRALERSAGAADEIEILEEIPRLEAGCHHEYVGGMLG